MLTELINFTENLSEDFKGLGSTPKEGLHILLKVDEKGNIYTSSDSIQYAYYSKKMKEEYEELLNKCKSYQENAWCVNTNKCFDLPYKAIHSCSPFCVAFKKEHLKGGAKFNANEKNGKPQIYERFQDYFVKAESMLLEDNSLIKTYGSFKDFIVGGSWENILADIEKRRGTQYELLSRQIENMAERLKKTPDKLEKEQLKVRQKELQNELLKVQPLSDSDYVLFYLNLPILEYKRTHEVYLSDKLFNTDKFNVGPNEKGVVYGTNDFQNGFNSNMPFLLHQTASFDITGRISNLEAKALYEFSKVLPRKSLPNPLPIFIYNDEFKKKVIALYGEKRLGFRDLVETLYASHKNDFQNYYLLQWANTKNGIVFNDFDFVSKFEYKVGPVGGLRVENLFGLKEKAEKKNMRAKLKHYPPIKNIFELEDGVLKYLVQNKYHRVDYFSDLKKEDYDNRDQTFLSFVKYRKAIYDYVYKSNRNILTGNHFDEMVFNGIRDDLKNDSEYGIKEKLNYWYSLYEHFHQPIKPEKTMANRLKEYQDFVTDVIEDRADTEKASDKHFAFSAGQVIYYLLKKSKSDDKSFRLIEPYLQKTNYESFQEQISEDFGRYKHESFSKNFSKLISFVLAHEAEERNMKKLHPQLLSGLFANNQLYSNFNNSENE